MKVEMKDSGIPWIGKIPKDWKIARIKDLTTEENTLFLDGDWIDSYNITDEGIRYLTTGNIGEGYFKEQGNGYISQNTFDKLKCLAVYPNDLAISRLNIPLGRSCIIPNSFEKYIVAVDVTILRCDSSYYKRYLMYCMNVPSYNEMAKLIARGTTMLRLSRTLLGTLQLPIPPYQLQKQIANFLDEKCADVDQLITLQQQMIDELKAYKQSVITEAVCKGLDKSVPMKDSGIEWIGEVPEGWIVAPLKNYVSCNDKSLSENEDKNKIINYIEIGSVNNCGEIQNVQELIFSNAPSRARRKVNNNDVIISCVRTYLKSIAKITNEQDNYICSTGFAVLRPNRKINPDYLYYCLFSDVFTSNVEANSTGISYPAINTPKLLGLKIIVPTRTEQSIIVSFLNKKIKEIDTLISIKQQKIDELKEYKKSMIYEYITGKKQVPNE